MRKTSTQLSYMPELNPPVEKRSLACHDRAYLRGKSRFGNLRIGTARTDRYGIHCGTPTERSIFGTILLVVIWAATNSLASDRPNVIVVLTDDQGWGDLSIHGNTNLETPNIDSLAREGASFEHFYVCPVCSPTRAEFLTGRYHSRSGVFSTSAGGERMDLDETTIADLFQAAGYATGCFGKWHNGMQYPYHPNGRGFDEFHGFCSGHWGDYFQPMLEHNGQIVLGNGYVADDFTDKTLEFIHENKDRPFFAYVAYNTPHSPMQVPDRWWDKFADKELKMRHREPSRENVEHTKAALAMCENIDWNVGRILRKLDELQLSNDTIVVFFCDNGPNGFRWNGGMKGRKGSTDEGGVRSALMIRWPGTIPAGKKVSRIAAAIDLLPTLTTLTGIEAAVNLTLDGASLRPLLMEESARWPERMIFSRWRNRISVRTQNYRLDHQGRLFDMVNDPGQSKDVAHLHPRTTTRLNEAVTRWRRAMDSESSAAPRPFPIGHRDYAYTQLPARDGQAIGNVKRSNRFPNCSFFTNWTSLEDGIKWNVEVGEPGQYDVDLYYTCPPDDVGSVVELSFRDQTLRAKVTVGHDPPLEGAENDRTKRIESYVKDFRPMRMGTLSLKPGRGTLALKAVEIPGDQVIDFRMLYFTRR